MLVLNGNVGFPGSTDEEQISVADSFNQLATKLLKICNNAYGNSSNCLGDLDRSPGEHFEDTMNVIRTNARFHFPPEYFTPQCISCNALSAPAPPSAPTPPSAPPPPLVPCTACPTIQEILHCFHSPAPPSPLHCNCCKNTHIEPPKCCEVENTFKFPVGYIYYILFDVRRSTASNKWIKALDKIKVWIDWVEEIVGMPDEEAAKWQVEWTIVDICGAAW